MRITSIRSSVAMQSDCHQWEYRWGISIKYTMNFEDLVKTM